MKTCFSVNMRVKRLRQAGSRRIKIAIRQLSQEALTEDEIVRAVKRLQQQIKNRK
jgi:hypothetical protein